MIYIYNLFSLRIYLYIYGNFYVSCKEDPTIPYLRLTFAF